MTCAATLSDLAERQSAIVDLAAGRGSPHAFCAAQAIIPTIRCSTARSGRRPACYLEDLGRLVDPAVEIMWTGEEVCSRELPPAHLDRVARQIGRKPFLWDNYPVNDGPRMSQHLHLRGFTGRPASIGRHISAHGINPALQPRLTLLPALTLAMSYRDGEAYSYGAAQDAAAAELYGDALAQRCVPTCSPFRIAALIASDPIARPSCRTSTPASTTPPPAR
jgi:hypothetical protein